MGISCNALKWGSPSFSVLDSVLPRHDLAEHSPLRGQIAAQEGGHVLPGDGVEHLGEAEGIIAVEIPPSVRVTAMFSKEFSPGGWSRRTPGAPAGNSPRRCPPPPGAPPPLDLSGGPAGVLAVAAGIEVCHARHHLKAPPKLVLMTLLIEPLVQVAGIPSRMSQAMSPRTAVRWWSSPVRRRGALVGRQELRAETSWPCGSPLPPPGRVPGRSPGDRRPALPG